MKTFSIYNRASITGSIVGLIGGLLLIAIHSLQYLNIMTYVLETLMFVSILSTIIFSTLKVNLRENENKYFKLFLASYLTYVISITCMQFYFVSIHPEAFVDQLKYFLISNGFGIIICGAITFLVTRKR